MIELCLRCTYFQFQNGFYEQLDGAAMGSPLSPVVANIFMESFEEQALHSYQVKPKMWVRYVDDTFTVWPHGTTMLESFHNHLNQQHPNIQFTREEESEGRIAFLDVLMERKGSKTPTSVYRKPTHTDRYINFNSHHHPRVLNGVIRCLRDRAHNICQESTRPNEMSHLESVFRANGYPKGLVRCNLRQPLRDPEQPEQIVQNDERKKILYAPYVRGVSEKIERICHPLGVTPVFKSRCTRRQSIMRVKTPRPSENKERSGLNGAVQ